MSTPSLRNRKTNDTQAAPTTDEAVTAPSRGHSARAVRVSASASSLASSGSSLGNIVVNGTGLTVYIFDKDTANTGKSACTGACLSTWPPVTTTAPNPHVTGISGTVATITDPYGKMQITINGLPLYTFAGDTAKGDVKGQGLQNVWWVLSPSGKKITTSATGTGGY